MAEKKGNGFKTFLLIFITVLLAGVFCLAGFLIVSPKSTIFGLQYRANVKTETRGYVDGNPSGFIKFSNYSQINVEIAEGKGHTSVNVNRGQPSNYSTSFISFSQNSSGFQYAGAEEKYTISVTESGTTLNIIITEPNYNFLQIVNNSKLNLNLYNNDNLDSSTLTIRTGSGAVNIGGQITSDAPATQINIGNLNVETTSGKIQLTETASLKSTATLTSKTGAINIASNQTLSTINMTTDTGKIDTAEIAGNVSIKSYNSIVTMGNITGNVGAEMTSGILNLKNISGTFISENKILYTTVNVDTITGETTLINDQGNFAVNIKKTLGATSIRTGNKNVNIDEVCGSCTITTNNGSISVRKAETNAGELKLESKGSGSINVNFDNVLGINEAKTNSGRITMKFGDNASYVLNASSEKSKVYLTWLDISEKSFENKQVPEGTASVHKVTLTSVSGAIRVERI